MEATSNRRAHYILASAGIIIGVLFDQFTKFLAVSHLKNEEPFIIIRDVFQLEYLENRGAAFGLFQEQRLFFYISVILITAAFVWFYLRVPMNRRYLPLRLCAVFIAAGAWGNCIDRIRLNYVVDFLYFKLIDFPVFNVADIYVTVSTFALILLLFLYYKEEELEQVFHRRKRGGDAD